MLGFRVENNFNFNMSYRVWLCVMILRSYTGFRVTLVYELTSYTLWYLQNSLTHLFYDQIVKYLIYVWWWFSLCWNSFELIQNFRLMTCLNIDISIQVIITKFYVKYYLLALHTSICVITNSLLNTWTIHLINDFVY